MTTGHHIVKSYDDELKALNDKIIEMADLTEIQFESAIQALMNQDTELAYKIIEDDDRIDDLNHEVDEMTMNLLALRQPMAMDLRNVVAAIKISSDLERIADYATNMARRTVPLINEGVVIRPIHNIPRMGKAVIEMLKKIVDAYIAGDAEKAVAVWHADKAVDEMYVSLFRELLTYMMEDPSRITPCTHVLFIAKNIERMGDHVTNVCETVYYLVSGEPLREDRPRKTRTDRLLTYDIGAKE
jgi:phosphate transport system protein